MPLGLPWKVKYQAVLAALVAGNGLRGNCGMTAKKISDSDKHDILHLYRTTGETTSTLAERYGVSNSTISRLLKSTLLEEEYETLISSKRAARTSHTDTKQTLLFRPEVDDSVAARLVDQEPSSDDVARVVASSALTETPANINLGAAARIFADTISGSLNPALQSLDNSSKFINEQEQPSKQDSPQVLNAQPLRIAAPILNPIIKNVLTKQENRLERLDRPAVTLNTPQSLLDEDSGAQATVVAQMLGEDLLDESEELTDLDDEDLEDLDDDDLDEEPFLVKIARQSETLVQVLPLSEATLPKTCYLVIDRASELITRPLRDFGDLGQIPTQEVQQKTLPVFDNHRVARRFSTKRDRVIKVPDSKLLQKTCSQLQAKGITRLLVDGQVYSLSK